MKPKGQMHARNGSLLNRTMNQLETAHQSYFFKFNFNIIFPPTYCFFPSRLF